MWKNLSCSRSGVYVGGCHGALTGVGRLCVGRWYLVFMFIIEGGGTSAGFFWGILSVLGSFKLGLAFCVGCGVSHRVSQYHVTCMFMITFGCGWLFYSLLRFSLGTSILQCTYMCMWRVFPLSGWCLCTHGFVLKVFSPWGALVSP